MREFLTRLIDWLRRDKLESELNEELAFHRAHLERDAEGAGLGRDDARYAASRRLGNVTRVAENARDRWSIPTLDQLQQDVRYAIRALGARKAFTAGVVLTLALGIGANATMFGVVDRLLLRPPPALRDQTAVHRIYRHSSPNREPRIDRGLAFPVYLDLARSTRTLSSVAAFHTRLLAVGTADAARERLVTAASASYFDFFDVTPVRGRFFNAADDNVSGGATVAVIGHAFWQAQFGGRDDVIGQPLLVNRTHYTIIGVAPRNFVGVSEQGSPAVYLPITAYAYAVRGPQFASQYGASWLELIVRRKAGVSRAAAESDVTASLQQSWRAAGRPDWGTPDEARVRADLTPVQVGRGPQAGRDVRIAAWVSGVAFIVLLIACANVTNLLLAHAVHRRREIAVRLALGASRGRLTRQLLTESAVIAFIGGLGGLLLAHWGAGGLRAWFLPADLDAGVLTDTRTLVFAAVATTLAAIATGLVPALDANRRDVLSALKAGVRGSGHSHARLRASLLVAQVALSAFLLVGAGLFLRSVSRAHNLRLGYDSDRLLAGITDLRGTALDSSSAAALNERLLTAARSVPGVQYASTAEAIPFRSNEVRDLFVAGVDSVQRLGRFLLQAGSPDYFATTGTRVLRGRAFDAGDVQGGARVVIIGEGMARLLWPGRDAVGECVRINADTMPCTTVIGVAEDVRWRSFVDTREFVYYVPASQYDQPLRPQMFVRAERDVAQIAQALRTRLQQEMPGAAYINVVTMQSLVGPQMRSWNLGATLFSALGGLALVLATVGLYSLVSYDVAQSRRELSIRVALGAPVARVIGLVVGRSVRLIAIGAVVGTGVALWAAPLLGTLMFRQSTRDPVVFGAVAAVLLVVGLIAASGPAIRASRVDPVATLRGD